MLTIVGNGSVGLVMGCRLAHSGTPILFVARSPQAADVLAATGVSVGDPATGERTHAQVKASICFSPPERVPARWRRLCGLTRADFQHNHDQALSRT